MLHKKNYEGIAKSLGVRLASRNKATADAEQTIEEVALCLMDTNKNFDKAIFTQMAITSYTSTLTKNRLDRMIALDMEIRKR